MVVKKYAQIQKQIELRSWNTYTVYYKSNRQCFLFLSFIHNSDFIGKEYELPKPSIISGLRKSLWIN